MDKDTEAIDHGTVKTLHHADVLTRRKKTGVEPVHSHQTAIKQQLSHVAEVKADASQARAHLEKIGGYPPSEPVVGISTEARNFAEAHPVAASPETPEKATSMAQSLHRVDIARMQQEVLEKRHETQPAPTSFIPPHRETIPVQKVSFWERARTSVSAALEKAKSRLGFGGSPRVPEPGATI